MMDLLKYFMCVQVADRKCWINQSLLFVINIADQTPRSSFFIVKLAVLIWSMNDTTDVEPKGSLLYLQ